MLQHSVSILIFGFTIKYFTWKIEAAVFEPHGRRIWWCDCTGRIWGLKRCWRRRCRRSSWRWIAAWIQVVYCWRVFLQTKVMNVMRLEGNYEKVNKKVIKEKRDDRLGQWHLDGRLKATMHFFYFLPIHTFMPCIFTGKLTNVTITKRNTSLCMYEVA